MPANSNITYHAAPAYQPSWFTGFKAHLETDGLSHNTLRAYVGDVLDFISFLRERSIEVSEKSLLELNPMIVTEYLQARGSSGSGRSSVERKLMAVKKLFAFIDPHHRQPLSLHWHEGAVLDAAAITAVFTTLATPEVSKTRFLRERNVLVFLLIIFHGLRTRSIPLIMFSDIRRTADTVLIRAGSEDSFTLRIAALPILRRYLSARSSGVPFLFVGDMQRHPLRPDQVRGMAAQLATTLSNPCDLRTLYRTYCSLAMRPTELASLYDSVCEEVL